MKTALLNILHNAANDPAYEGLPKHPTDLYNELLNHKANLLKQKILKPDQLKRLYPTNKRCVSDDFDVTLLVIIIRYCTTLGPPWNGWKQKLPSSNDRTIAAFCIRAREMRNLISHYSNARAMKEEEFRDLWKKMNEILQGLQYHESTSDIRYGSLDPHRIDYLKSCLNYLEGREDKLEAGVAENADNIAVIKARIDRNDEDAEDCVNELFGKYIDVATEQRLQKTQLEDYSTRLEFIESGMVIVFSSSIFLH